jgi:peptidoglycan/LPS O-acetylase OafA/YrhL
MKGEGLKPKKRTPDRIPFVEGMRGIAALYVVLGHLCSMSDPSQLAGKHDYAPPWFRSVIAPFAYGHLAVAAFIVISGFCLQISLFKGGNGQLKSLGRFFAKRAKRILPAYYGSLILSVAVAVYITTRLPGMPFEMYLPVTSSNVLAHVFLVHNWSPASMYKLNGVLWSIAIEAQLYLLFPLIVLSLVRVGRRKTFVLSVAAAYALSVAAAFCLVHYGSGTSPTKLYAWFLPLFVLGMVSAHVAVKPHPTWGPAAWVGRAAGLACLGACFYGTQHGLYGVPPDWMNAATDVLMGGFVACFCYAGSITKPTPTVRLLSTKPLLALGAFSYSLYLVHNPIQQVVYYFRPGFVSGEVDTFWYLVAMLPVIILAAWIFSLLLEKPFMSKPSKVRRPEGAWVPTNLPLKGSSRAPARPDPARPVGSGREPRRASVPGLSPGQ